MWCSRWLCWTGREVGTALSSRRQGAKGVREWITTVPAWPSNFEYRDMARTAVELSERLRDAKGEYRCDLVIALTHAR